MKPFNLEDALVGKPVVTRDGQKVVELHRFSVAFNDGRRLVASTNFGLRVYWDNGRLYGDYCESDCDLFMAPVEREYWVNLYESANSLDGNGGKHAFHYSTQFAADSACATTARRIGGKAHKIVVEE